MGTKIRTVLVFFIAFFTIGYALQCYDCNVLGNGKPCNKLSEQSKDTKKNITKCSRTSSIKWNQKFGDTNFTDKMNFVCGVMTIDGLPGRITKQVTRDCVPAGKYNNTTFCELFTMKHKRADCYICQEDLCNGSGIMFPDKLFHIVAFAVMLLIFKMNV